MVATLTLYAFLGIESATIPAENIENPEKTVPKATMLGTIIATLVYILGTVVLFGIVPNDILQESPVPFAEAAELMGGKYAGYFVAAGAAIAAIGALNGWILVSGQIPMAAAKDKLFPRVFKKENNNGVPVIGLLIGSVLSSLVMFMNYSESLVDQFEFMVLLTTLTCLVPYLFTMAAYVLVIMNIKLNLKNQSLPIGLSIIGFFYALWAIYGSLEVAKAGSKAVLGLAEYVAQHSGDIFDVKSMHISGSLKGIEKGDLFKADMTVAVLGKPHNWSIDLNIKDVASFIDDLFKKAFGEAKAIAGF
jgi:APA family basic amino acid/polyamine antiporter